MPTEVLMNADLLDLIGRYQSAVAEMFPRLARHLGVELPVTNTEWAWIGAEQRGRTEDGIEYFIHGYGVTLNSGEVEVDFDLGDKGQIDGFDLYRLKRFIQDNDILTPLSDEAELTRAFESAVESSELVYSGYINFYLQPDRPSVMSKLKAGILSIPGALTQLFRRSD